MTNKTKNKIDSILVEMFARPKAFIIFLIGWFIIYPILKAIALYLYNVYI